MSAAKRRNALPAPHDDTMDVGPFDAEAHAREHTCIAKGGHGTIVAVVETHDTRARAGA
jgi:hypothetical protein